MNGINQNRFLPTPWKKFKMFWKFLFKINLNLFFRLKETLEIWEILFLELTTIFLNLRENFQYSHQAYAIKDALMKYLLTNLD